MSKTPPRIGLSEEFVLLFRELRRQFGDKPDEGKIIEAFSRNNNSKILAERFDVLVNQISYAMKASNDRIFRFVYPDFPTEWDLFQTNWGNWGSIIFDIKNPEFSQQLLELLQMEKMDHSGEQCLNSNEWDEFRDLDISEDSPSSMISLITEYLRQKAQDSDIGGFERWAQGLEWFCERGVNFRLFESRWKELPLVLVPRHVSNRHDGLGKNGFFYLLEQARLAYIFGLDAAAISMLRALTEEIIDKHYCHKENHRGFYQWPNGMNFPEVVRWCEKKYPMVFKGNTLCDKITLANKVLHEGRIDLPRQWSKPDTPIKGWMLELKRLVEMRPLES